MLLTVEEAQRNMWFLLRAVKRGEQVFIMRDGVPIAQMVPFDKNGSMLKDEVIKPSPPDVGEDENLRLS